MADEPTWDDLFAPRPEDGSPRDSAGRSGTTVVTDEGQPLSRREALHPDQTQRSRDRGRRSPDPRDGRPRRPRRPRRRRRLTWLWVLLTILVLGGVGAGAVWTLFGTEIRHVLGMDSIDYTGKGNGQPASVTIVQGQIGSDIATSLQKAGVTKTYEAFYKLLLTQSPQATFEPGTYKLEKQMSAKAALAALEQPGNRVISKVVIPEGTTLPKVFARLSAGTGVPVADFQAAAKNYKALGVPAGAPSLEGFLFPATYTFTPGEKAPAILQAMVTRMDQSLTQAGVAPADELRVLTLASIIQKEAGSTPDFYKVSRVFTNRLSIGMLLQSDATVSYGSGGTTISTTKAERADPKNLYNTYVHKGLPVGPISAPGDAAIDAALHPVAGPWLYFVLVNGDTKQTVFSTTIAQHDAAVKQWQAWLRAHPGYSK